MALARPPDEDLTQALTSAGVPEDQAGDWLTRSRSLPSVIAAMYLQAGKDGEAGWRALVTFAIRALPSTRQLALQAHQIGPRLLEAVARDRPPCTSIPGAAPALVANALAALREVDLIWQPAPRRWEVSDPVLQAAILSGPWDRRAHGMPGHRLRPQPGSRIAPEDAVGRSRTTARARRELLAGNNLILSDPRRMGKTVWLDLFAAAPGDGLRAIKVDVEGTTTTSEFVMRILDALMRYDGLPKQAARSLRTMVRGRTTGHGVGEQPETGRSPADALSEAFAVVDGTLGVESRLVVVIDEFPAAVANIARHDGAASAGPLLQTLRSVWRRAKRIRWILSGEGSLRRVLKQAEVTDGTLNDLVHLPLGPLDAEDAYELARRLMLGIERAGDDQAVAALAERSGGMPFLGHALAHRLHDAGVGPATPEDVDRAFAAFIGDRDESRAITHFVSRLGAAYADRAEAASAILDRVAVSGSIGASELDDDHGLLDDLIDDYYLVERAGSIEWRYEVLRRIWAHRRRLDVERL